jgi:hypothetical protein
MQVSSGGSQTSKKKKPSYPTPKKGIVGINVPKTPIKSKPKSSKPKSTSYSGGGNSGFLDRLFGKKPASKKAPAKKPAPKPAAKKPTMPKPTMPKANTSSAYTAYKAITAPKKSTPVKPVVHKTTGQSGLEPNKYHNTAPVKAPVKQAAPATKAQAYHAAAKATPTAPIVHSAAPSKAPVTTKAPAAPVAPTPHVSTPATPTVPATPAKPAMTPAQSTALRNSQMAWYNNYNKQIANGTNNLADLDRYNGYVKNLHLNKGTVSDATLHQLSLKALSGDTSAQNYLKTMGIQGQTGAKLWNGYDTSQLKQGSGLWNQYYKDNPNSSIAKNYDMTNYNNYANAIKNKKSLNDNEVAAYRKLVDKWNLTDYTDPYEMQQYTLGQDKQNALNAQDVSLNQGLAAQDATNFQQFQQLQQQMAGRGMSDSGVASDAYMRAQMGANANYQQAYADAATQKASTAKTFDDEIYGVKQDQIKNQQDQQAADNKATIDGMNAQAELQKQQTEQDKYLTSSTGFVYVGGKQLTVNGKPITSMEYNKLTETQRHNLATENNTATANANTAAKNANDYTLGQDKNDIARTKIATDLQVALSKNKLDQDKLTFSYTKLDSDNAYHQALIKKAADAAQNATDKTQLTALGKQTDTLTKQISAIQKKKTQTKADKAALKKLVSQYNNANNAINKIIGGSSFKTSTKGSDGSQISKAPSGIPTNFGGYRKVGKQPAAFNTHMSQAIQKGVPFSESKLLTELIGRESGFRPTAQNPTSTAYGYGQFLTSTRNAYAKRYPDLNYNNPVDQIVLTYKYIKDRYGTVQNALSQWEHRSPHWY